MHTLRSTWLTLAAGVLCTVAIGCSGPANNVTTDPTDQTSNGDTPAPTATGDGGGSETPSPAPSGPKAPDFTLSTLDGDEVTLSDLEGQVVLVDFWSTTCDPCLAEMPELVKLYNEKKDQGFTVLAVTIDGPETTAKVPATVKKNKMNFPILLDPDTEAMDRYNPKGELPFTAVVDRKGHVVMKRAGYQPGDEESWNKLVAAVDGALAAK